MAFRLRLPPKKPSGPLLKRTGRFACGPESGHFASGFLEKKPSGPFSGQPHVFKDCGTATGSLETVCKERRQALENRRSGLFNPGCGSKTMRRSSMYNVMLRSLRSTARIKKSGSQIQCWLIVCLPVRPRGPGTMLDSGKDFVSNPDSPVHMVVPFNIIRAKRVFGPENGISLKASFKKTLRSPPQDDRRICMRTGKWAFRLGLPPKKTLRSLARTTTRSQRLRHRRRIA